MKISAKDEYGLRILLRIAEANQPEGMSIPQLSEAEGLSASYVAKLTRLLRMKGFIQSTRGHKGGYILCRSASDITVNEVLKAIDGALFDASFCDRHGSINHFCTHNVDCSVRSLWRLLQKTLDNVLDKLTLSDLMDSDDLQHKIDDPAVKENQVEIAEIK